MGTGWTGNWPFPLPPDSPPAKQSKPVGTQGDEQNHENFELPLIRTPLGLTSCYSVLIRQGFIQGGGGGRETGDFPPFGIPPPFGSAQVL